MQRLDAKASEAELRSYLGGFAFQGDMATTAVAPFSGGEKARLVLALIVYQKPNLLLLDEPTNHLDLEMRLALTTALQEFVGAMIVVSHDRHLLRSVADTLLLVADGKLQPFDGDLDDYRRLVKEQSNDDVESNLSSAEPSKKQQRQDAAAKREQLKPLQNKLKKLEKQMHKYQTQNDLLHDQLAGSEIYEEQNKQQLKKTLAQQADTQTELEAIEEQWMELSEKLEGRI